MKIKFLSILLLLAVINVQAQIKTPQPSPTSKIEQKVGLTDVTLEYSRPSMRSRTIFGDLVPFEKKWRTGANANTKISFSSDVTIDGKNLKEGTYAIYTIPRKDSWEVIFYSDAENWGLPQKWDDAKIALKTTVKPSKMSVEIETFTMNFDNLSDSNSAVLYILWEKTAIEVKINVPTEKITLASIENVMNGPSANDYYTAGLYYFTSGKDLNKAKEWVDKAISMKEKPAFWQIRQQSLIYAALGDKKGALKAAKKSLELATVAKNTDYIKMNNESIAKWSK